MAEIPKGIENNLKTDDKKSVISESKDFKKIGEDVKRRVDILTKLEKSSIIESEEDIVVNFLIKNFTNQSDIENNIKLIIDYEAETLNDIKSFIEVDKEDNQVDKEDNQVDKEDNQVDKEDNQVDKEDKEELENIDLMGLLVQKALIKLEGKNSKKYKELQKKLESGDLVGMIRILENADTGIFQAMLTDLSKNKENYTNVTRYLSNKSPRLESVIRDFESTMKGKKLSTDNVVNGIEKNSGGVIDIDLGANPPVSNMRLLGSEYGFDKEIDKNELSELTEVSKEKLDNIKKNGFDVLNGFTKTFNDKLLYEIGKSWGKEDFYANLENVVDNFVISDLSNLDKMYDEFDVPDDIQIRNDDILDMKSISEENPEELRVKIENIQNKMKSLNEFIGEKQTGIYKKYEDKIKALLIRNKDRKKKQLEVLKKLKNIGYDLIPKEITDKFINEFKSNVFNIKGLELNPETIDIKNGRFGEGVSEKGGDKFAQNIVKFMEKMMYGEVNHPDSIFKGKNFNGSLSAVINDVEIKEEFKKVGIKSDFNWNITIMRKNLKK